MSIFKRITATVSASMDNVVSRVENHDAIIEASIKQTRQTAAKTRSRLNSLRKTGVDLKAQLEKTIAQVDTWSYRAKELADVNQDKALQCLARRKQCLVQVENLEQSIKQHQQLETQVAENLATIERKLSAITTQHHLMRSRQSASDVNRVVEQTGYGNSENLNDAFERWEASIIENETLVPTVSTADPLEEEFKHQEDTDALLVELEQLKAGGSKGD